MLKLLKKCKELSKEDMIGTEAGKNCGTMGCSCPTGDIPEPIKAKYSGVQYLDYWQWYAVPY